MKPNILSSAHDQNARKTRLVVLLIAIPNPALPIANLVPKSLRAILGRIPFKPQVLRLQRLHFYERLGLFPERFRLFPKRFDVGFGFERASITNENQK